MRLSLATVGKSPIADKYKLQAKQLKGKWEQYLLFTDNGKVVILGSDKRGTIYGIYELSRQIGVSPWHYWADVPADKHDVLFVKDGCYTDGEPKVKYRGIFINDEAPCTSTWIQNTFNRSSAGVGYYEKCFDLLLRLKANYMWPAMWMWSFYADDPGNSALADKMGIMMGTSHHEPMARNHQEWARHRKDYGEWDYETNQKVIDNFFREGIKRCKNTEDIITIGMRGDGDTGIGGKEGHDDENMQNNDQHIINLLERIVKNQRQIIAEETGRPAKERTQIWALYKEVQRYYDRGLKVPDDVIILLSDDNWGDIRRLPSEKERNHKGGFGMYYHVDYVGAPRNSKWLNVAKVPLGIYCLSGTDSTRRFNRFMHRIGEAPVIYEPQLTDYSRHTIEVTLHSQGYLHARVTADTTVNRRRTHLRYNLVSGRRHYIKHIDYIYDNDTIRQKIEAAGGYTFYHGMPLDITQLDAERSRIIALLRAQGYYHLNPEYITFEADTLEHELGANLICRFKAPSGVNTQLAYQDYRIGDVRVHELPHASSGDTVSCDTTLFRDLCLIQPERHRLNSRLYRREVFLNSGDYFNDKATQFTYQGLNSLPAVNYATVRYVQPQEGDTLLNADVYVNLNQPNSISFDLEGTNTAGDLGGAASMTFTNRNMFRGSESFSVKLRGAYEAIRHLEGYQNQNYIEYSAEGTLRLSSMPFISRNSQQPRVRGNSELSLLYNSQDRPEFHRRLLTGTWSLNWNRRSTPNLRHRFDIIQLNYVFMPWISDTFTKEYLEGDDPRYAVLRYSYENLFIMKAGYNFTYNSLRGNSTTTSLNKTNGYQIKFNVETAGNLLYGISHLAKLPHDEHGQYAIFNIPYSQYARLDFDFSKSFLINERHSIAVHSFFGLAIPYGNSSIVPYEKRYFSGGANSVRGWSVRQLGPGSYKGQDGNIDFINQTGNLKIDLSAEYRTALFWKLEGALFIDAGNVWNTRNYADQPGGYFQWDTFYKQIAVAYGLGLRLNFNYFILRLDGGMKAINPTVLSGRGHWPIIHPRFGRDFALHFAVGLPF